MHCHFFLIVQNESDVQQLITSCIVDNNKLYFFVSSPTIKKKPVEIRIWHLNDSNFIFNETEILDPKKTIFIGGVPRAIKACK